MLSENVVSVMFVSLKFVVVLCDLTSDSFKKNSNVCLKRRMLLPCSLFICKQLLIQTWLPQIVLFLVCLNNQLLKKTWLNSSMLKLSIIMNLSFLLSIWAALFILKLFLCDYLFVPYIVSYFSSNNFFVVVYLKRRHIFF